MDHFLWGRSSPGRALEWHSRGSRFDPDRLHLKDRFFFETVFSFYNKSSKSVSLPITAVAAL